MRYNQPIPSNDPRRAGTTILELSADTQYLLNAALTTLNDSHRGFLKAAELVDDAELAAMLENYAIQRKAMETEVSNKLTDLSQAPSASFSPLAAAHRIWMDIEAALVTDTAQAILREAMRGERAALDNYDQILRRELTAEVEAILRP